MLRGQRNCISRTIHPTVLAAHQSAFQDILKFSVSSFSKSLQAAVGPWKMWWQGESSSVPIENAEVKTYLQGSHPKLKGIAKLQFLHPHSSTLATGSRVQVQDPALAVYKSRSKRINPEGERQECPVPGNSVVIHEGMVCMVRNLLLRDCQDAGKERQGVVVGILLYLGAVTSSSPSLNCPPAPSRPLESISSVWHLLPHAFPFLLAYI